MAHQIEHAHLPIRGLNLHVAHVGKGERGTVVFLHGFPEIWYSWRHQMLAVAAAGYHAVAPDCRGYGLSDQPPENEEEASWDDLVADVLGILDTLSVAKAFVVGKDFGAIPAHYFVLRHPDRTRGVVSLGMPFSPGPFSLHGMPEGFYILRWREPDRAEADFGWHDVKRVVRTVYILFSGAEVPVAEEGQEIMDLAGASTPLPEWFTEEDLDVYASLYENSGFRLQVPVFVVTGGKDYAVKIPGEATLSVNRFAPDLKVASIPEGSHLVQEQLPEQVNELLLAFVNDHPVAGDV
ncbi:hypothetical protein ACP70R_033013 [Stipagrostis hirtigluma subsp. patula]